MVGDVLVEAYDKGWCRPYTAPNWCSFDAAKNLGQGAMAAKFSQDKTVPDQAAGEANWQFGKCVSELVAGSRRSWSACRRKPPRRTRASTSSA